MEPAAPVVVPTGTTPQPNPVPAVSGTAPKEPVTSQYVTLEQFTETQRRLDGISASLRKLEPLAAAAQHQPAATTKEPDTLQSLKQEMDARDAKITSRERNAALSEALEAAGVPADRRTKAAKYILAEHAGKMQQIDDGSFRYTENGEAHALTDWVALYMKTDDGKFINPEPAPTVPTGKGFVNGKTATGSTGQHPGMKMSYKDLMDAKNPSVRASFQAEHPEEFAQKKAEYFASR